MRNSTIKRALIIFVLLLEFTSCKKKGCMDINADNYDSFAQKNNGTCAFRYTSSVYVESIEGANYDSFDGPELYVVISKNTSSTWDYKSSVGSNSYSTSLTIPIFLLTNEKWKYQIYDEDTVGDDLLGEGEFNPLVDGKDREISVVTNGIKMKFSYLVK